MGNRHGRQSQSVKCKTNKMLAELMTVRDGQHTSWRATVHSESIHTLGLFSHVVVLKPEFKIYFLQINLK